MCFFIFGCGISKRFREVCLWCQKTSKISVMGLSCRPSFNLYQLSGAKSHRQGENIGHPRPEVMIRQKWAALPAAESSVSSASIYQSVRQLSKASVSINKANNHRLQTACLSVTVLSLTFTLPGRLKLPAAESSSQAAGQPDKIIINDCRPIASLHNAAMWHKHIL